MWNMWSKDEVQEHIQGAYKNAQTSQEINSYLSALMEHVPQNNDKSRLIFYQNPNVAQLSSYVAFWYALLIPN